MTGMTTVLFWLTTYCSDLTVREPRETSELSTCQSLTEPLVFLHEGWPWFPAPKERHSLRPESACRSASHNHTYTHTMLLLSDWQGTLKRPPRPTQTDPENINTLSAWLLKWHTIQRDGKGKSNLPYTITVMNHQQHSTSTLFTSSNKPDLPVTMEQERSRECDYPMKNDQSCESPWKSYISNR